MYNQHPHKNIMNHHIYELRNSQLDDKLKYKLAPFISAYKPHGPIPTKEQLMSDNRRQKDLTSPCSMDRLEEQSKRLSSTCRIGHKWW